MCLATLEPDVVTDYFQPWECGSVPSLEDVWWGSYVTFLFRIEYRPFSSVLAGF